MPKAVRIPIWKRSRPILMHQKFGSFIESPITWGAVGVLVGALAVAFSMRVIFCTAGVIFCVAIVRTGFFEGRGWLKKYLGNLFLMGVMGIALYGLWRVTPKIKEPATAEEIAVAVIKKQHEDIRQVSGIPPQVDSKKTIELGKKTVRKTTKQPAQQGGTTAPTQPTPPPQQARLIVSQKQDISTREDAPFKTIVTVQATADFPTLKMLLKCDKPLMDGQGGPAGVMMMTSQGIVKDHPNIYIFTYQSAAPPFGPQNPLILTLWSKEAIKCEAATF
jgi:hypothetical protein